MLKTIFYDVILGWGTVTFLWAIRMMVNVSMERYDYNLFALAYARMHSWRDEGRLPNRTKSIYSELVTLTRSPSRETANARLAAIAGPNGWTMYQALKARKRWWN